MKQWLAEDECNDRYMTTHDVKIHAPDDRQLLLLAIRPLPAHRAGDAPFFLFRSDYLASS